MLRQPTTFMLERQVTCKARWFECCKANLVVKSDDHNPLGKETARFPFFFKCWVFQPPPLTLANPHSHTVQLIWALQKDVKCFSCQETGEAGHRRLFELWCLSQLESLELGKCGFVFRASLCLIFISHEKDIKFRNSLHCFFFQPGDLIYATQAFKRPIWCCIIRWTCLRCCALVERIFPAEATTHGECNGNCEFPNSISSVPVLIPFKLEYIKGFSPLEARCVSSNHHKCFSTLRLLHLAEEDHALRVEKAAVWWDVRGP